MPDTCKITFENNPLKVCSPDQWILGNVVLTLAEEKKIRGVYVNILGKFFARKEFLGLQFQGQQQLLSKRTYLAGSEEGEIVLPAGEHNYNFQCLLPANLPSSCEGKGGYVRYGVYVILDVPFWLDTVFEEIFTVVKAVDLNSDPINRESIDIQNNHKFWPLMFSSDSIDIGVRVPVKAYAPGQFINIDIDINNKSGKEISEFSVKLIKEIKYSNLRDDCCGVPVKRVESFTVNKEKVQGCGPHEEKTIRVNLYIPPVPPTDEIAGKLLQIRYSINITDSKLFTHLKPRIKLPIVIGTYPLQDILNEETNNDEENQEDVTDSSYNHDIPNYVEEKVYDKKRAKKLQKSKTSHSEESKSNMKIFQPIYPVFDRQTSYSSAP